MSAAPSTVIFETRGLSAAYGHAQVLFGVDLQLRAGEVVALMGRNGAGKSTTLKAIMGIVPPNGGTVTFEGQDVTGWQPFRIARLGLVGQRLDAVAVLSDRLAGLRIEGAGRGPRTAEAALQLIAEFVGSHGRGGAG